MYANSRSCVIISHYRIVNSICLAYSGILFCTVNLMQFHWSVVVLVTFRFTQIH